MPIWQIENADASYVLDRMRRVKRYADILQHLFAFNKQIALSEKERVAVLCEMYQNGEIRTMIQEALPSGRGVENDIIAAGATSEKCNFADRVFDV